MNSFEVNKVLGAVLGALLFAAGSGFVAELIYHPRPAGKAGYDLPEPEAQPAAATPEAKVEPIAVRLASANAEKGEAGTKACRACHNFEKGGPNKVGPDLYSVVERQKGGHAGFEYSAALKGKGGTWTYDDLDAFLASPKGYAPGTKMAFAGIASPQERANVIAYLRNNADSPKPLPAVEKSEAKPEAAPAAAKPEDKPAPAPASEDKPSAAKPAAGKGSEGKDSPAKPADIETAKPVEEKSAGSPRAPSESSDRNAPAPPAGAHDGDQQGAPSSAIPAEPTAPSAPAAKEPPAQANPEAVDRAKDLEVDGPTKDLNAPLPTPKQ